MCIRFEQFAIVASSVTLLSFGAGASAQSEFFFPVPRVEFNLGSFTETLVQGDFNGDGAIDLVTSVRNAREPFAPVNIFLGNGDGSFVHAAIDSPDFLPTKIVPADLNGDGTLDLLGFHFGTGELRVYLGNGDGTFAAPMTSVIGGRGFDAATGDVNNDGNLDFLMANFVDGTVIMILGVGDGTFMPAVTLFSTESPVKIVVGHFDGDAALDTVVVRSFPIEYSVALGNGDGTFASPIVTPGGNLSVIDIVVFDVDADGANDLVSGGRGGMFNVLYGNGDGTFESPRTYFPSESAPIGGIAAADINGDGLRDIVTGSLNGSSIGSGVAINNGDRTFSSFQRLHGHRGTNGLALADFDSDGDMDLAAARDGSPGMKIYLNNLVDEYCAADCDDSGDVDFNDLLAMLFAFGPAGGQYECNPDESGAIDFNDLVTTLFYFGPCN